MKVQPITLEAVGDFPFTFYIEKAQATDEEEKMIIEGVASTTNIDHDNERMSADALKAMANVINKEGVPIRVEHQKDSEAIIGRMFKAWIDERNQLHVQGELDKSHPVSSILHHSIKNGVKMGLSVGGIVKRAVKEFAENYGNMVKTFYDVALQEVSVTPRPANYDAWLVAKSIAKNPAEAQQYHEHQALRNEFLFENSQLDYLQAFAKSIPDKAWRKVESPNNINKQDDTNMPDKINKESETTDETTKAVSRAEFDSLNKGFQQLSTLVSKGFESVTALISKAMDGDAKDTTNPDKKKPEDESPTAKMTEEAHDQNNPSKDKPADESATAKTEDTTTDETTKAEDETTDTTKAEADEDTDTYDMETVTRSINRIDALTKRLSGKKKSVPATETTEDTAKAEDTTTDETTKADEETTETTKTVHPIDKFVVKTTQALERIVDNMEKSGHRVLGFEKSFVEDIQNSPVIQEEIRKMMKIPGAKKSVSMGVPYMVMKNGQRFPLIAVQTESVEKSKDEKPKNFKDLYKSQYSSVSPEVE